jgi:nucleoside-diphosphate-sugar epimerase
MRILIAGASGAIGRPLVHRLRANQYEVFALTRSPESALLNEIGAEPISADATPPQDSAQFVFASPSGIPALRSPSYIRS